MAKIKLWLTLLFLAAAFYYLYNNMDRAALISAAGQLSPVSFIAALFLIAASQALSALRMQIYLREINIYTPMSDAIKLYFSSMFLNIILPGGIGGDAYKCLAIRRRHAVKMAPLASAALSERASGLLALLLLVIILAPFTQFFASIAIWTLALPLWVCYRLGVRILLQEKTAASLRALPYSVGVQLLQLAAFFMLLSNLVTAHYIEYGATFLASSVMSILPFSVGGLGLRELTFYYAAENLSVIDGSVGVVVASAFFLAHLPSALLGGAFIAAGRSGAPQTNNPS